ncbi:hypothetical protein VPNG_05474 [Cytospora leucostoma]|uniref:C3H1-type domain-containing protein n=1 Tax=Cytospora leucostoma TaxID=1230097 RepID=A0A423XBN6_9PEZI|nr:hypothetical protein VPNG_05474 [Cytospora leucostoma]
METLPGTNVVGLQHPPNSPSDISCSSGIPSVVSTRETSPASSTHHPLEVSPAGTVPLQELSGKMSSDPRKALEMNDEFFRAIKDRRSKVTGETSQASHASPGIIGSAANSFGLPQQTTGRPLAPNAPQHRSTSLIAPSTARQLWRTPTTRLDNLIFHSSPTSSAGASSSSATCNTNTNNSATTSGSRILSTPNSPVGLGNTSKNNSNGFLSSNGYCSIANFTENAFAAVHDLHMLNDNNQLDTSKTAKLAKMHPTNGSFISEADMDKAMGYCYDRGDGQYTRLIAVDLLPIDLRDIPRRATSDQGMIVLPVPRMPGPNGQPADKQLEPQAAVTPPPSSPSDINSADRIQTRIDTIVACSPQKQITSPTAAGTTLVTTSSAVANNRPSGNGRRDKIYCDKWIHDGTCAFTQQGCKFKHEMPNDKETQEKLGLFHGYPAWWKKLLAEQQRPVPAVDDRPVNHGGPGHSGETVEDVRHTGGFGTGDIGRGSRGSFGTSGGSRQGGRGGGAFNAPNYGPIGQHPSRVERANSRISSIRGSTFRGSYNSIAAPRGAANANSSSESNLYAALMDLNQDSHDDNSTGAEEAGDVKVEDEEQRGAKL